MRRAIAIGIAWLASGAGGCGHAGGSASDGGPRTVDSGPLRDAAVDGRAGPAACEGGRMRTYYHDGDGDGFGVPGRGGAQGCDGNPPDGLADNARDCDDTDSSKQEELFADADADGYGDAAALTCVATGAHGYSRRADDCDDADSKRSPAAAEGWFDAHDANCDGADNPAKCVAAPGVPRERYATPDVVDLPPLDRIPVETAPECAGSADLYLAIANGCPVCFEGLATVVVGNAGAVGAAFRVTSNEESVDVMTELPPQRVAEPLSLRLRSPESTIRVSPLGGVADCRPDNDTATVEVGFTDC